MPNDFKLKQSSAALLAALAAAFPLTGQAASAARVDFALGDVKALAPDGRSRPLARGAEIASGEMIDTGSGRAQVRFTDGAQVSLAPQTQFRIDDYRFAGKADGSEKGFFSLLKGAMRTITGLVGRSNRDNYRVTTTVATIGIRGTEYSITYGNSINVTTGKGSNEVCNAAGCLILNSGETAYVADNNTQPVMTDKKAEIPPPPAQEGQLPGFTSGNDTTGDGTPATIPPATTTALPSGPGYSIVGAGYFYDTFMSAWVTDGGYYDGNYEQTYATFDGNGLAMFTAYDGAEGLTRGTPVGMLTDGVMGWGRWVDATGDFNGTPESWEHLHYVVGIPTSPLEMASLTGTATYTLTGYTYPTAYNGAWTIGTQPITGTLTADFSVPAVMGTLSIPLGVNEYSTTWSASISGAHFTGAGTVAMVSGSDCLCGCTSLVEGFFAGSNASHAGLAYEIISNDMYFPLVYGDINGAAVFKK
ncbi:MAG: FecR domain-containing protein [Rhodocyclaceae bacterium]